MSASIENRHFLLRRVHSLLGLVPVGGFLAFHMWENSQAWQGQAHYNEVVQEIASMNLVLLFEVFGIALPILFHAAYGLVIAGKSKPNVVRYGYLHNWGFLFQRVSGFVVFAFIVIHVWETRLAVEMDASIGEDLYGHMARLMTSPRPLVMYVVGTAFAAFHLANGLWTMGISWGLTTTVRAQKISFAVCMVAGAALFGLGIRSLLGFVLGPDAVAGL